MSESNQNLEIMENDTQETVIFFSLDPEAGLDDAPDTRSTIGKAQNVNTSDPLFEKGESVSYMKGGNALKVQNGFTVAEVTTKDGKHVYSLRGNGQLVKGVPEKFVRLERAR